MSAPQLIADLCAEVFRRVNGFAASNDVRYYLCGVHVVPGLDKTVPVRMEGTNGHVLYAEEDTSAVAQAELIVRLGRRAATLLRRGARVKVYDNQAVHITDGAGATLYIEPGTGVVDGKFPAIAPLVGVPGDWHEGLAAPVQAPYLLKAMSVPGYVRFFSRKDADGKFSLTSSVMFVLDGGTTNGGKAFGMIMPVRMNLDPQRTVADMLPGSLAPQRAAAKVAP